MTTPEKIYLGDGVYASFDGYQIWLTTDGSTSQQEIALEPIVWNALKEYAARLFPVGGGT